MAEQKTINIEWLKIKPAEIEKMVVSLYKEGNTPQKIGMILRDRNGIPKSKILGKRVTKILKEAGITLPSERKEAEKKVKKLEEHLAIHKHDYTAKRSLYKKRWLVAKADKP